MADRGTVASRHNCGASDTLRSVWEKLDYCLDVCCDQRFTCREPCHRIDSATAFSFDSACDVILRPPQIDAICSQFMCLNMLRPQPEEHVAIDSMTHQGVIYSREPHSPDNPQNAY
ncbi:hypothetical protein ANN_02997 [Periplaneta americana]|uniref:Uncharacterized protein n=1 Tax=Periplaneta americana TaxID=6978 RepID=A0ABQ8U101_PERAM|nr:hypothetical protein ANN_02997 [Periplaneta americana]